MSVKIVNGANLLTIPIINNRIVMPKMKDNDIISNNTANATKMSDYMKANTMNATTTNRTGGGFILHHTTTSAQTSMGGVLRPKYILPTAVILEATQITGDSYFKFPFPGKMLTYRAGNWLGTSITDNLISVTLEYVSDTTYTGYRYKITGINNSSQIDYFNISISQIIQWLVSNDTSDYLYLSRYVQIESYVEGEKTALVWIVQAIDFANNITY